MTPDCWDPVDQVDPVDPLDPVDPVDPLDPLDPLACSKVGFYLDEAPLCPPGQAPRPYRQAGQPLGDPGQPQGVPGRAFGRVGGALGYLWETLYTQTPDQPHPRPLCSPNSVHTVGVLADCLRGR